MALFPGGVVPEVVFSFDTTGSMSSSLNEVRGRLQDLIQRLQADIPAIRLAVFAHGDYCDVSNYVTKHVDFSTDVAKLCEFVKNVSSTGGGDGEECYELVLREAREELSWTPDSRRALIMIGDAPPHEPDYPDNKLKIDWRIEAKEYARMGCRVYPVQVGSWGEATKFYQTLAKVTGGRHLKLSQFQNLFDFLMAVCYREHGQEFLQVYEKEVRARCVDGSLNKDLHGMFSALRDDPDSVISPEPMTSPAKKPSLPSSAKKTKISKKVSLPYKTRKVIFFGKAQTTPTSRKVVKKSNLLPVLLRRERVPETNFALNDLVWSQWYRVISPSPPPTNAGNWTKRRGDGKGYRLRRLFPLVRNGPALYEMAVQSKFHARRVVVCCRFVARPCPKSWENRLLGRPDLRTEVDRVIKAGCIVWARRAAVRGPSRAVKVKTVLRRYDYAWSRQRKVRVNHRSVTSCGVLVSHDTV